MSYNPIGNKPWSEANYLEERTKMSHQNLIADARARYAGRKALLCEEAAPQSREYFIPCAAPAARFVLSERGRVVYAMCAPCASHNVRNRGCQDLGPTGAAR